MGAAVVSGAVWLRSGYSCDPEGAAQVLRFGHGGNTDHRARPATAGAQRAPLARGGPARRRESVRPSTTPSSTSCSWRSGCPCRSRRPGAVTTTIALRPLSATVARGRTRALDDHRLVERDPLPTRRAVTARRARSGAPAGSRRPGCASPSVPCRWCPSGGAISHHSAGPLRRRARMGHDRCGVAGSAGHDWVNAPGPGRGVANAPASRRPRRKVLRRGRAQGTD